MNILVKMMTFTAVALLISACGQSGSQFAGSYRWLTGDTEAKFAQVEDQLGGFGKTMWEVDYRFQELYWAGKEMNWEYANHQVTEISETINNGLIRRPERAASAQQFINSALPELGKAVEDANPEQFERRIQVLISTCNSCHALEEMQFLTVNIPVTKPSSIR